jgi:GT2 family glycosyltransferase
MSVKITSSIVLYKNDKEILLKAINSYLLYNSYTKLFLVDNSPTDNLKYLKNNIRIEYIHNPTNPGFGAAHNIAIKKSIEIGADYHLVLNPDVYFNAGTLEAIIEYMEKNSDVGNLMPRVCYPDGSNQFLCKLLPTPYDWVGRRFNPFKYFVEKRNNKFELKFTNYDKIMEVPYLSGCFMFLRLDALKKIGLFDEGIFMYGEETDLCRRLNARNYKTIFFPEVKISHEFEKGSHKSLRLTWIGIKSAIYYFNKWGWFFDTQRAKINKNTLNKLGYNKKYL